MATEPDTLVLYVRNADPSAATAALRFNDDRSDLEIGKVGWVTEDELHRAAAFGVTLEPIEESEAKERGLEIPPKLSEVVAEEETPLRDRSLADLKTLAIDEYDLDAETINKMRSKDEVATAIEDKQNAQPEGTDSLPATATSGPTPPTTSGAGSAGSGPGLAPGGGTGSTGTSGTA